MLVICHLKNVFQNSITENHVPTKNQPKPSWPSMVLIAGVLNRRLASPCCNLKSWRICAAAAGNCARAINLEKFCSISPCYLCVGGNYKGSGSWTLISFLLSIFLGKTCDGETSYIYSIVPNKVQHDNRIFLQILDILCPSRLPYQPHPDFTTHFPPSVKPTRNSVWLILCCRRKGPPQRPPCPSSSSIHSSQRRGATCNSCSLVNSAGRGRGIGTAGDARCIAKKKRWKQVWNWAKIGQRSGTCDGFCETCMKMTHHHWWGGPFEGDHMIQMTLWYGWMSSDCIYCILVEFPSQNYSTVPHLEDDHN